MRENVNRDKVGLNQYGFRPLKSTKKRLDLNDLLQKVKSQRKVERKFNLLIFCVTSCVAVVFYLLLSL